MILDKFTPKAKGHVKIETYKDFYGPDNILAIYEKDNLVVNDSSKIIAKTLSDPVASTIYDFVYTTDTSTFQNVDGFYELDIPYGKCQTFNVTIATTDIVSPIDLGIEFGVAEQAYQLEAMYSPVKEIISAKGIGSTDSTVLTPGVDVFVVDAEKGIIGFDIDTSVYNSIELTIYQIKNRSVEIVPGSEKVETTTTFQRSKTKNTLGQFIPDDPGTYGIDYNTGKLFFASQLTNVTITYKYRMSSGVNYMGISDKPEGHTVGYPVVIPSTQKFKRSLDAEFLNSRQPLIFPCNVEIGTLASETADGSGVGADATLESNELRLTNTIPIYKLVSVQDTSTNTQYEILDEEPAEVPVNPSVWLVDHNVGGKIAFSELPAATTNNVVVTYRLDDGITVNFVADFAPGLPQPQLIDVTEELTTDGSISYKLQNNNLQQIYSVTDSSGTEITGCFVNANDELEFPSTPANDTYTVNYQYEKRIFDIYEVGLFNGKDEKDSYMFSIAGIGPITKDENTGMRITWSITFESFKTT